MYDRLLEKLEHAELCKCQIGIYADMPQKWIVKRFLNDTNYLLSDVPLQECPELREQLCRWKKHISKPVNKVKRGTDLNDVVFPLPAPIKGDPLVLRPWGSRDTFRRPSGGSVQENCFNTNLDESSAWEQIKPNLLEVPTDEQERIWRVREKRTDINDKERMRERRREIADSLALRHEWPPSKVEPFLAFADNLKAGWEAFQTLCRKDWISPRGPFNRRTTIGTAAISASWNAF